MPTFDLLLRGGLVIDGTGAPRFAADVGIEEGHIAFVGDSAGLRAEMTLDIPELVVAPGFIDSHAHDDWAVLAQPDMTAKISQGVTTVINGNCGNSLAPYYSAGVPPLPLRQVAPQYQFGVFGDYLRAVARAPASVNVASLIGHTTLRVQYVSNLTREASDSEIRLMRDATRDALEAGAIGLSSGTFYPPATAATPQEIVRVGADLKIYGGLYTTHMRDEADAVLQAIDESASIAKELGVRLVVSHHKVMGARNFGRTSETLEKIALLAETQEICMDCYPYVASSSLLRVERLPQCKEIIVTSSRKMPDVAGRSIESLTEEWHCSREEAMLRVMPGTGMYFMMHEEDVSRVLANERTMVGSDGIPMDSYPHPRLWGSFTRVLGLYSREKKLFSLETAVHKMTGLTAEAFGLEGRGKIRAGFAADLTVFDPRTVGDGATYTNPTARSDGIVHVIVNGQPAWQAGSHTGARSGKCLRRGQSSALASYAIR